MSFDQVNPEPAPAADTSEPASAGTDGQAARPAPPPAPVAPPSRSARRSNAVLVAVAVIAVLAGSALFASGWTLGRQSALTPGTPPSEADAFQPFWDTYRAITDRYAGGEVDRKALVEGAIKGMISALDDPYSQYLTSAEFKASLQDISGEFEGIGATIGTVDAKGDTTSCSTLGPDCRLAIVQPITGSPADKAGLRPGDIVDRIDGTSLDGLTVDQARDKVRGPKDTTVTLTIVRGGGAPFDVAIVRAVIVTPEVETKVLAGGTVGYIKLSGFSDHAAKEFDATVAAEVAAGRKKLILDLRGNPGGFVTAARDIASQFLASGTIFWEQDAQGNLTQTVAASGGAATDPAIRLVVLVDGGSASASEIVAAALHDNGRATLVGSKTFGKGTVQQWTQLEGDYGGFRLTIARWLTPDKVWIHGKGIEPDVVVTATPQKPGEDPALDAALGALDAAPSALGLRAAA
jgi:carboxyl-terminal processing protease